MRRKQKSDPTRYDEDLATLGPSYRAQFDAWFRRGVIPTIPSLRASLAGYWVDAIDMQDGGDLPGLCLMLTRHAPPFSWGSEMALAKWEYKGGMDGPQTNDDEPISLASRRSVRRRLMPAVLAPMLFTISGAVGCACCELPWDHGGHITGEHHINQSEAL